MNVLRIEGDGLFQSHKVFLDDIEITRYITKLTITFEPDGTPRAEMLYTGKIELSDELNADVRLIEDVSWKPSAPSAE